MASNDEADNRTDYNIESLHIKDRPLIGKYLSVSYIFSYIKALPGILLLLLLLLFISNEC
jgi:hypothetical protein